MQTKDKIAAVVKEAVVSAMQDGTLKFSDALPEVALEVPPKKEFGDYATNFAMQTAKIFRTSPRKIAEEIKARIDIVKQNVESLLKRPLFATMALFVAERPEAEEIHNEYDLIELFLFNWIERERKEKGIEYQEIDFK